MSALAPLPRRDFSRRLRFFLSALILTAASLTAGCGSGSRGSKPGPALIGSTEVTVMVSGTANDQLTEFDLGFQSITLTSQSGKTATLFSAPTSGPGVGAEFMHVNGTTEPLSSGSVPQDVYTGATVSLGMGQFVCVDLGSLDGQPTLSTAFFSNSVPASAVSVTLPSPLTVTGTSMALSLDLMVSESATIGNCLSVDGFSGFSMAPAFHLTPLNIVSSPTNAANGKVAGLDGQITAMGTTGNSFTLSLPSAAGPRTISISAGNHTVYQGIGNFSALAVGSFVNMDGAIQADGSLLATRIAVEDTLAADVFRGPLMEVTPSVPLVLMRAREQQGKDFPGYVGGFGSFKFGSALFQTSGQFTNLGNLPFVPSFNASNMVPGQEVYTSIASFSVDVPYPVATTMTLMPQSINATVVGSSAAGSFTDYTVSLASYDLFPMLADQPDQTTVENNPSQIEVYVDGSTQLLNAQPLAAGSTLRFYGLVFNDNGTLRMDCAQVSDGVAFTTPPSASQPSRGDVGQVQQTRVSPAGPLQQSVTVITQRP
jgi:hypothetical protein